MEATPGPWRITDDFIAVYDKDARCIASLDSEASPGIGLAESLANARLIAAAPDLFMACHAALAYLADPPSKYKENRDEATRIIRDAIRKAVSED